MGIVADYINISENNNSDHNKKRELFPLFQFLVDLFSYIYLRIRQFILFVFAFFKFIFDKISELKSFLIRHMFWGRGSFYRTAPHILIFAITVIIAATGISSRLGIEAANSSIEIGSNIVGQKDIIYQSGTVESLSAIDENQSDFEVYKYVVESGDTLSSIAKLYNKNINTLVWANNLSNANAILKVGQVLRIPAIDGAYYKVKKGDTLQSIAKFTKANEIDIWDLNSNVIDYDNPVLTVGMELFIPNGVIPTPTRTRFSSWTSSRVSTGLNVPSGTYVHPLLHCSGWTWSRGFSAVHGGADMAKHGGCWINSIANGYVKKAGYGGWGHTVIIDHGNGLVSIYGHGNGRYAVKAGDYVKAGQDVMYMGNSGYSFGTHLHLEIQLGGRKINPESVVKLR